MVERLSCGPKPVVTPLDNPPDPPSSLRLKGLLEKVERIAPRNKEWGRDAKLSFSTSWV